MCGIAGEFRFDGSAAQVGAVLAMAQVLEPRGPDGWGIVGHGPLALAHQRLKIIDLTEAGSQPMVDAELGLTAVFNGCIYNYPQLREELGREGYRFFSTSDTEVIIKAFHKWGQRCVEHFKGMFAFAIADRNTGRLVLGRDRLGIKPLYVARVSGRAALRLVAARADRPRRRRHRHRPRGPAPLHELPRRRARPAHDPRRRPEAPARRRAHRRARRRARATGPTGRPSSSAATRSTPRPSGPRSRWSRCAPRWSGGWSSDVPVGVLLSGGIDSSIVVALLAEMGQKDLKTYSIGFESEGGEDGDEFDYSDLVAETYGTDHTKFRVPKADTDEALPGAIAAMSEPMTSHDVVAFYLLSREVSKSIKVVQSGQGADEVLGGYDWYPPIARVGREGAVERLPPRVLRPPARRDRRAGGAGVHAPRGPEPRPGARALRTPRRRRGRRRGAAPRHHGHARRRPGEAGRQHDDGLGPRGARAVPRPRLRRDHGRLPARAQDGRRRQGRAQGGLARACSPTRSSTARRATSRCRRSGSSPARCSSGSPRALTDPAAKQRGLFREDAVATMLDDPNSGRTNLGAERAVAGRTPGDVAAGPRDQLT